VGNDAKDERAARLKAALRANLGRRKQQARARRKSATPDEPAEDCGKED